MCEFVVRAKQGGVWGCVPAAVGGWKELFQNVKAGVAAPEFVFIWCERQHHTLIAPHERQVDAA